MCKLSCLAVDHKLIRYLLQKQQTVAEWCGAGMVVCLEQGADLHMAQLMPLPLTVSCFTKIQIGFSFLVLAHLGSPGKRAVKWVCVRVSVVAEAATYGSQKLEKMYSVARLLVRLLLRLGKPLQHIFMCTACIAISF